MEVEVKNIKEEAFRLAWNMRGGLQYNEALLLSIQERETLSTIITENIETTKKSGLPYF